MSCFSLVCYTTFFFFFFFNDTATTEIYTLSLHDALPISITIPKMKPAIASRIERVVKVHRLREVTAQIGRSEEHTSELQSHSDLVCRLLLEKKKKKKKKQIRTDKRKNNHNNNLNSITERT